MPTANATVVEPLFESVGGVDDTVQLAGGEHQPGN